MKFQSLNTGTKLFGRFEILTLLGEGGVSHVYKCRDLSRNGKKVALKVLMNPASKDPSIMKRFLAEVEILNSLKSPNVIANAELFRGEGLVGYSMEYVGGESLADKILRPGQFAIEEILSLLIQVCRAVEAVHKARYIHRDLKPENMLITDRGQLKLIDFGIAIAERDIGKSSEGISGTMNYASPEYIEFGVIDRRSDIYAIGAIAFELITKQSAFDHPDPLEVMKAKVRTDAPLVTSIRRSCPEALAQLTAKALSRDPNKRYQEVGQIINEIKSIQSSLGHDLAERVGIPKATAPKSRTVVRRDALAKQIQSFLEST